jgi:hypothetical protein
MRLTLRTLLAYRDDILEPAEAKEIGEKIHVSSFASSLVERINDVLRRRRIGAPDVSGPGSQPDANVVAEYLDNLLSPEEITEFERICLGSDEYLAEVAATHQVLTLVLGESIEIPSRLRERIYALGAVAPPPDLAEENGKAEPIPKISGVKAVVADRNVSSSTWDDFAARLPDQLRRKPAWKRSLPYILGALILVGWGYMMVTDYITTRDDVAPQTAGATEEDVAAEGRHHAQGDQRAQSGTRANGSELPVAANRDPGGRSEPSHGRTDRSSADAQRATPSPITPPPMGRAAEEPIDVLIQGEADLVESSPPPPSEPRIADAESGPQRLPDGPSADADPESTRDALAAVEAADPAPAADSLEPPQALPKPPPLLPDSYEVQYVNADGAFLHHDAEAEQWSVMPRRSLIFVGEEIASPEPFDSRLTVSDDTLVVEVILRGGTRLRLLEPTVESRLGFEIDQGRVLIVRRESEAARPLPLRLKIRNDQWLCEFSEPQTVIGVEVVPVPPSGVEDMTGRSEYTGGITLAAGSARLTDTATGQAFELHPEQGSLAFSAHPDAPGIAAEATLSRPDWMLEGAATAPLVRQTATRYEREFLPDQPISQSIRPVVKDRQPRISELATKTLALTGSLPGLIDALSASHEESRIAAIEGIRSWLPRDEQNGRQLQSELENRFREEDAAALYRLLWGYSPSDARNAFVSAELVDWMADEEIAIRELAAYHVHHLTGRHLGFRADRRPDEREAVVRRWREHLEDTGALLSETE